MPAILIIEDDVTFSQLLEGFLQKHGFSVAVAFDIKTGKKFLRETSFDLLLLDYRLPDGTGMDILEYLREQHLAVAPIIMTSFNDVKTAVTTIRSGAFDYITKPVNPDELLMVIRAASAATQEDNNIASGDFKYLEGKAENAKKLRQHIELVAPTDFSVIIQGESGTGKELAAQSIHQLSKRKNAPFIALDCGALSTELAGSELFGHVKGAFTGALQNKRGHFEEAEGGTLFLDEVGNLGYEIQIKLLRALQEQVIQPIGSNQQVKTNVRIICASNDNLFNAVRNGKFREDLYHRLNEFTIHIPALRERREDIPLFIDHFIRQTNTELGKRVLGVTPDVMRLFLKYDWPGNLRELKNIIKRSVLLTETNEIGMNVLPQEMLFSIQYVEAVPPTDLKTTQQSSERELIIKALEQANNNKAKAARILNIDRSTLYYKLSKYNITG